MTKYRVWARVIVGVGFELVEAEGPAQAIQKLVAGWPSAELSRMIDAPQPSVAMELSGGVNVLQYDEGTMPLEFRVDVEGDDEYEKTTHWQPDPDSARPILLPRCEKCGAVQEPAVAPSCSCFDLDAAILEDGLGPLPFDDT